MFKLSDISIQRSHALTVDAVCESYPGPKQKVVVLDVGAGTGRVAEEMLNRGFQLIDALESSDEKLDIAKKRSLYDNYYTCGLTGNFLLPIRDDVYDIVVSCEGFGDGKMPCTALREIARVTKPGGVVVIAIKEEDLHKMPQYLDRFEPALMELQTDGYWELLSRDVVPYFSNNKTGVIFTHRRCGYSNTSSLSSH